MGRVRIEFMSWLADTVHAEKSGKEVLEEDLGDCRTVKDMLVRLAHAHAQFEKLVFDADTLSLNPRVAVFHNGRQIELESGLETPLGDGDGLVFVPVVAGG